MLQTYLKTIVEGLYELHTRGAVREEGSNILAALRVAADQAHDAAQQVQTAVAVAGADSPTDAGGLVAALVALRDDVASLRAVLMARVSDATPKDEAPMLPLVPGLAERLPGGSE